ncbi:hypothetical protein [Massilia sp. Leaf139]|uniref:hypothetical protein n=1 Tax=Massilia sp. Leaf139 TaxID=1736272 RepID=UPI0006F8E081|nr:hypothetical protein [Massilia sp. Leaf139]KQQ96114.1 hypothetical protein ASF77_21660 [Massilia sp. Leaf139]
MHTAEIAADLTTPLMARAPMAGLAILVRAISQDFDNRFGSFGPDASTKAQLVARLRLSVEQLVVLTTVSGRWHFGGLLVQAFEVSKALLTAAFALRLTNTFLAAYLGAVLWCYACIAILYAIGTVACSLSVFLGGYWRLAHSGPTTDTDPDA